MRIDNNKVRNIKINGANHSIIKELSVNKQPAAVIGSPTKKPFVSDTLKRASRIAEQAIKIIVKNAPA